MNLMQAVAVFMPHLLSAPLLPLAILATTVLALSTLTAADTTVQARQEQRLKEESGEALALTKVHAIGFGFMASIGLLAMWMWSNVLSFTITLMLKVLKASSMSSPTLLLLTAFVYDVFFVFVTPYLTKTGESIMEAAATGAAMTVKETIPMLFRIPSHHGGEAMLGFGDVVLPGILVTFLKECDARLEEDSTTTVIGRLERIDLPSGMNENQKKKNWWQRRWGYHLTAILGYIVGLETTFVAMMWSGKGQPALLYLVPCTVLPVAVLASRRHELSLLWHGWSGLEGEHGGVPEIDQKDGTNEDVEHPASKVTLVPVQ
ncbi:Signal peptide peptidase-like 2B [Mortierella sp. GBA30]|nr:Signal peptide peptidase-like 2B [Mortierella sp. GBA30]